VRWKQKKFDQAQQTEAHIVSIADPIEQKWPGAVLVGSAHDARTEDDVDAQRGNIKFGGLNLGRQT